MPNGLRKPELFHSFRRLDPAGIQITKTQPQVNSDKRALLAARRATAIAGGGPERTAAQKQKGKLTARERLQRLFDGGNFAELDTFASHRATDWGLDKQHFEGDSVVAAYGQIDGRTVFAYSQDFTVFGGSMSEVAAQKICKVMDLAVKTGAPVVGINDGGGARIQEGVDSLAGYGEIFKRNTLASGVVPQITVVAGPAAGGAVYSPAITDFIFMVENLGQMYITGPDVIKAVTGEEVTHEDLGGAATHASKSGVAHFVAADEAACFTDVRKLLSFLPSNNTEPSPAGKAEGDLFSRNEALASAVPENPRQPYDIMSVVSAVVDRGDFLPVHRNFAPNIVVGFGRINGKAVGVVANQPAVMAGNLDINASDKAARFVRFCDCFNIPLVTFVDVPGFMPGTDQEFGGIIRHGAKLLYAYAEATVPKVAVILRKAYGGAYIVMSSKHLRGDINLAWPSAEVAVMGPEGAVNVIRRREIADSKEPEKRRAELVEEYKQMYANPYVPANRGYIDDIIDPADTRGAIVRALKMLENKVDTLPPKKHGNIPL